jgi:hypothetical protein
MSSASEFLKKLPSSAQSYSTASCQPNTSGIGAIAPHYPFTLGAAAAIPV